MPVETIWTDRGIEWRHWGVVTMKEIQAVNTAFMNDPRSDNAQYQLVDLREVDKMSLTEADFHIIGAYDVGQDLTLPAMRVALLVPDDRFDEQLAPYEETMKLSSWSVKKFTDENEARRWATSGKTASE